MPETHWKIFLFLLVCFLPLFACQNKSIEAGEKLNAHSIESTPVITANPTNDTGKIEAGDLLQESLSADPWEIINPDGQSVHFWHPYSDQRQDVLNQLITDFNRTNEWGIKVNSESKDSFSNLYYDVLGVLNTPDSPNMVLAYQDQSSAYYMYYGLADMETLLISPKWGFSATELDDFYRYILKHDLSPKFDNHRLGFPFFRALNILYYNDDWLKELGYVNPPLNPEEFKEVACKSSEQHFSKAETDESKGYGMTISASTLINWAFAFGADIFNEDNQMYNFDSEETVQAAKYLQELVNRECATVLNDNLANQKGFAEGKLLFTTGTSSGIPFYQNEIEEGLDFNWNIAPLPHPTTNPTQNVYGPSISILKTNRESELASWFFIKFLTGPEAQELWSESTFNFPVRKSSGGRSADFKLKNPQYAAAGNLMEFGKSEPSLPGYNFVQELVAESLAAILRGMDANQVLSELTIEANALLENQKELPLSTIESIPVPETGR
jgi:multiple sugar transport system substrate-binding protein/sn-glycerol 3-phosphate transport system substrate-binding protein